jgi:hypothetical protein
MLRYQEEIEMDRDAEVTVDRVDEIEDETEETEDDNDVYLDHMLLHTKETEAK